MPRQYYRRESVSVDIGSEVGTTRVTRRPSLLRRHRRGHGSTRSVGCFLARLTHPADGPVGPVPRALPRMSPVIGFQGPRQKGCSGIQLRGGATGWNRIPHRRVDTLLGRHHISSCPADRREDSRSLSSCRTAEAHPGLVDFGPADCTITSRSSSPCWYKVSSTSALSLVSGLGITRSAKLEGTESSSSPTSVKAWQTAPALPSILSSSVMSFIILSWSAMHSWTSLSLT